MLLRSNNSLHSSSIKCSLKLILFRINSLKRLFTNLTCLTSHYHYAILNSPVEASFVGIVSVNVPAVIVCDPKVKTATALFPCVEL